MTSHMADTPVVDLRSFGADFTRDPFPFYERLREQAPIHRIRTSSGMSAWLVVGYEQGRAALADPRLSKEWANASPSLGLGSTASGRHMLYSDPPSHTRLRRLVSNQFTARRVQELEPKIQRIADELVDAMLELPEDNVDLVGAYCVPLPILAICELLGVPELDRGPFKEWSDNAGSTDAARRESARAAAERFIPDLLAAKRRAPGEDLLSMLIRADGEQDRLSPDELLGMTWLLLVAGHETTANFLANGVLALLRNPEQLAALRADPALVDAAIEEMLRYDGPLETPTYRFTSEPTEIAGTVIPGGGELVLIALADANRDPERYPEPGRFDIARESQGHLAFGHGIHYCLGAPLARLEGRIAIGTLLRRCQHIDLGVDAGALVWRKGIMVRGPRALPVKLHRRDEEGDSTMPDTGRAQGPDLSRKPAQWWRALREADLERVRTSGTTASLATGDAPGVVLTTTGAKSGVPRAVPVIRFEYDGAYAVVASKGGDESDPDWCLNLRAHREVTLQDGSAVHRLTAREIHGDERDAWWLRIVAEQPVYARYAARTRRRIPIFVLEGKASGSERDG